MDIYMALTIFSSVAIASCLFIILYFLFIRNENKLQDRSLGFLFFAICLRISKSIFYFMFPEFSVIAVALGFLGFASIGPLLLMYFRFSTQSKSRFRAIDSLHFVIALIGSIIIVSLDNYQNQLYLFGKAHLAVYLIIVGYQYIFSKDHLHLNKWYTTLFYAIIFLLASFVFQFYAATVKSYTIGTGATSLIIYVLFFYILKNPMFGRKTIAPVISQELKDKITNAIEKDQIFKQPAITLVQFSKAIDTPSYLVSKATNSIYDKSFPEVINCFRIAEIKKHLETPNDLNETIEELAFDVGFNTSSAFYNAFKKETSMTPRAYQKMAYEKAI